MTASRWTLQFALLGFMATTASSCTVGDGSDLDDIAEGAAINICNNSGTLDYRFDRNNPTVVTPICGKLQVTGQLVPDSVGVPPVGFRIQVKNLTSGDRILIDPLFLTSRCKSLGPDFPPGNTGAEAHRITLFPGMSYTSPQTQCPGLLDTGTASTAHFDWKRNNPPQPVP